MNVNFVLKGSQGIPAALVMVLCGGAAMGQSGKINPAAKASIVIASIPPVGPGESSLGEIRGIVKNAPEGSKVLVYALGDLWYVQPFASSPWIAVGKDGKWSATIHGGFAFVAYLVRKDKPAYEPAATTASPPKLGGALLAMARKKQK